MTSGERTSVYLAADLAAAVKASDQTLAELIRRGLAAGTAAARSEPSPGVACMGPGCWQRDTSRFGLRKLPLCTACAAALQGRIHQREIPPSAARLMRRGAA
jgi:hypothetical protein